MSVNQQIRLDIRGQRRALSLQQQKIHSLQVCKRLAAHNAFRRSQRIAFYIAADGELDPQPLLHLANKLGKKCFLPALRARPSKALWFVEYRPGDPLRVNRFGIPEPRPIGGPAIPWGIDLVLLPLVAFDSERNRLGMGGGYYDRTLSFLNNRKCWHKPKLIGLAHELQKITRLSASSWDVPLDVVLTESSIY